MKLVVTRGLPGSGKTTYARAWVAEDPATRVRVNRDDLRAMTRDGAFIKGQTEQATIRARDALIRSFLIAGLDVISDDTNLPQRVVRDLKRLADLTHADFEVIDLTNVDRDTCVAPLPLPEEPTQTTQQVMPYVAKPGTPKAIIVDVDGTVALMGDRSPFDETRVHEDRPNEPVITVVQSLRDAGHQVVFCSGRTSACRDETAVWLIKHVGVDDPVLLMRAKADARKDSVVKLELFDLHIRDQYDVRAVLDDRKQVVAAWRSIGLTVLQVADGDF